MLLLGSDPNRSRSRVAETTSPFCSYSSIARAVARPGWSAFVTAAKTDGTWRLLEVGFVYP